MKNYFYIIFLGLAAIALFLNGSKLKQNTNELRKVNYQYQIVKKDSEIFLNSLLNKNITRNLCTFLLTGGDTLKLNETKTNGLYFFFPANECMSCVEQNIFALLDFSKKHPKLNIYVLTVKQQIRYINIMSKSHRESALSFGVLLDEMPRVNSSFYFFSKVGDFSNVFYPSIGEFEVTELYLKKVEEVLNQNLDV